MGSASDRSSIVSRTTVLCGSGGTASPALSSLSAAPASKNSVTASPSDDCHLSNTRTGARAEYSVDRSHIESQRREAPLYQHPLCPRQTECLFRRLLRRRRDRGSLLRWNGGRGGHLRRLGLRCLLQALEPVACQGLEHATRELLQIGSNVRGVLACLHRRPEFALRRELLPRSLSPPMMRTPAQAPAQDVLLGSTATRTRTVPDALPSTRAPHRARCRPRRSPRRPVPPLNMCLS